jgi:hypothetical protein
MLHLCGPPGNKAARTEADHSPPSSAEVKNEWSCATLLQYIFKARPIIKQGISFMMWDLVKPKDNLPLPLIT